jgi:hypothetical protein
MPRKKGDWHTQRSRFIKEVFLTMFSDSESDEDTLLDLMFNDGKYDWLLDTPRVIRAVQARYKGNTRAKAFTALFQLCEVKCGAYLAESSFDEAFEQAKMVYVDMQKTPNEPSPADSAHVVAMLGCLDLPACASMAAASGHLALKWWMAVSAGDLDLAQPARVGLAAVAPVVATVAPTAATTGTYDLNSLERATATLPAMPAQRSTAGRPTNPRLALVFHGGSSRAAEREAETVVRYACLIRCAGDVHGEWVCAPPKDGTER